VSLIAEKILIVEDSPTMRQLYRIVLGPGRVLIFAESGVEGLDRAAEDRDIELFIVDINMPEMDGLEFLRRARRDLQIRDTPAIVISTEGSDADREAARDAGANGYLQKPWTPDQLIRAVTEVFTPGPT
jgi:two-component system, chemotaxis family, chemotaxis protein CheY